MCPCVRVCVRADNGNSIGLWHLEIADGLLAWSMREAPGALWDTQLLAARGQLEMLRECSKGTKGESTTEENAEVSSRPPATPPPLPYSTARARPGVVRREGWEEEQGGDGEGGGGGHGGHGGLLDAGGVGRGHEVLAVWLKFALDFGKGSAAGMLPKRAL